MKHAAVVRLLVGLCLIVPAAVLADGSGGHDHGHVHHPITTKSERAQALFDQGLSQSYGFNHPEAAHTFRQAIAEDPECSMCYWGLSYVLGPNINAVMDPSNHAEAWQALQKAKKHVQNASASERAYVEALSARYSEEFQEDRSDLDAAYAKAMRRVSLRYPEDVDASVLYAEALMDTTPWDYWLENGEPKKVTEEFIRVLESALNRNPTHPGGNHMLIHAVEAVRPELGIDAADRLQSAHQATSHLIHMASHIYIRVGRYDEAVDVNLRAAKMDDEYLARENHGGDYNVGYVPHNRHMAWAAATLDGRRALVRRLSDEIVDLVDRDLMTEPGYGTLQHFLVLPMYARVRFGDWDEILELPEPAANLVYPRGVWHYARGMAMVADGQAEAAKRELAQVRAMADDPAIDPVTIWDLNTTEQMLRIGIEVLAGRIAQAEGRAADAISHLEHGVELEDSLTYDEPPPWPLPVRQVLGATLLEQGRASDAEAVYRRDLEVFPDNGWSLLGLSQALKQQGQTEAATTIERKMREAWPSQTSSRPVLESDCENPIGAPDEDTGIGDRQKVIGRRSTRGGFSRLVSSGARLCLGGVCLSGLVRPNGAAVGPFFFWLGLVGCLRVEDCPEAYVIRRKSQLQRLTS